jgi:hypothetical protein
LASQKADYFQAEIYAHLFAVNECIRRGYRSSP